MRNGKKLRVLSYKLNHWQNSFRSKLLSTLNKSTCFISANFSLMSGSSAMTSCYKPRTLSWALLRTSFHWSSNLFSMRINFSAPILKNLKQDWNKRAKIGKRFIFAISQTMKTVLEHFWKKSKTFQNSTRRIFLSFARNWVSRPPKTITLSSKSNDTNMTHSKRCNLKERYDSSCHESTWGKNLPMQWNNSAGPEPPTLWQFITTQLHSWRRRSRPLSHSAVSPSQLWATCATRCRTQLHCSLLISCAASNSNPSSTPTWWSYCPNVS